MFTRLLLSFVFEEKSVLSESLVWISGANFFAGSKWLLLVYTEAYASGLQSSCTLLSLSFCVLCPSDVETVRSLVEEMDSRDEKMTDNDPIQHGIGKRVIGKLVALVCINFPVHLPPFVLRDGQKIRVHYLPVYC